MSSLAPLVDRFGRVHRNLRISVTDRCNIRCFYCMPMEDVRFLPRSELLTFEEIERFVRVVAPAGIDRLRITGGEPLVRTDLPNLIDRLVRVPGIRDVALTTNGLLLSEQASALAKAGLHRLNISLDGMSEATFERVTRRSGLQRVLDGIATARSLGFRKLRLNAVALRGITEAEVVPLGSYAREQQLELRFIEFMPLDAERAWQDQQVLSGDEVRTLLEAEFGPLVASPRSDRSQPAVDYQYADGGGAVGFINPVTAPFCSDCNRLRITAEGQVRNCLFSSAEWDVRAVLRAKGDDGEVLALVRQALEAKQAAHGIDAPEFRPPQRAMYQIGG